MLLSLQRSLGNQAVGRILQRGRTGHPLRSAIQRQNRRRRRRANTGTVTIRNVQYQYYNVSGRTLADVHSQLDPTEWGRCSYHYSYTYRTRGGNASRVNITLRLTIRLPRWTGRGWNSASRPAKAEWRRMLRALRAHENRHAAIARRWAPTFKQRMLNQPEGDLEDTFNQVLGEVDAEQGRFDTRTSHGQTQGVSLDTRIQ
jgi:predicted secreted Zn-dependent protease